MELPRLILAAVVAAPLATLGHSMHHAAPEYLPNEAASRVVGVTSGEAPADAAVIVLTQAVAIEETGPNQTVARFGEVYAFALSFIAVHRDEPTAISFWNLQGDDATTSCSSIRISPCS